MELGSEYNLSLSELTIKDNNVFRHLSDYFYAFYFDSGRSALRHLSSYFRPGEEILLPEFICESVTNCFRPEDTRFYKLNNDFTVDIRNLERMITTRTRAIFLMHYFGSLQPDNVLSLISELSKKYRLIIIEDTTHSFFSKSSTIGDYQICSIRKWIPIPNGGVLYANEDKLRVFDSIEYKISKDNERAYGMLLKDLFLRGELNCNAEYRRIFSMCEEKLDAQAKILFISDFVRFIISCVDIEFLTDRRIQNYMHLKIELEKMGISPAVKLYKNACPLVLPILVQNRDEFRTYLMENKIYCAVHWPFDGVQEEQRPFAELCAKHLISLPIDQRYKETDINYLVDVIRRYGVLIC